MQPFDFLRVDRISQAATIGASSENAYIAGGTDLLQLMKDDIAQPERLVDITGIPGLNGIEAAEEGLHLGALARMSDVANHADVRAAYPVIAEALALSASAQVRNMATIGGNLLQRTRCLYFRDPANACNKRQPGSGCGALEGENRLNAVLGGSAHCVAVHPSDLAVALVALDAQLVTRRGESERRQPLDGFHLVPGSTPEREHDLRPGELIVAVDVPASPITRRSCYVKARDRASFEFALASAAVAVAESDGTITTARIALGGVATKPWRCREAESSLVGKPLVRESFEAAAEIALAGAQPLLHNAYKIELAKRCIIHALTRAGEMQP
jgi:xanthine dehydrogenase YagS FAD-binding subunit